jgi:hypothetical protein
MSTLPPLDFKKYFSSAEREIERDDALFFRVLSSLQTERVAACDVK